MKYIAVFLIAAVVFSNDLQLLSHAGMPGTAAARATSSNSYVTDDVLPDEELYDDELVNDLISDSGISYATGSNATASNATASNATASNIGTLNNENSIIVYTYEELKTALGGDNAYTTIYLGDNITTNNSGVAINAAKPYIIIDGIPPGHEGSEPFTLTQYNSTNLNYTIRVEQSNTVTKEVTLRNLTIAGGNYYGIVAVLSNDVIQIHENIDYSGPQPAYNRAGTMQFIDSTYELKTVGGVGVNELAETKYAEFGGEVMITAENTSSPVIKLESSTSSLVLQENASLTVRTKFCFINTGGYTPEVTLKQGASLNLTSSRFGFTYGDHRISTFLMEADSSLFIDLNTTESYAALRVSKLFKQDPGSSLNIIRTGTAGIPLRLTNLGASAVFNEPHRVFLYSSAGVPLRFTGNGTLEITTQTLNVWEKTAWPAEEGSVNPATHIWNRAGAERLVVTGTYQETVNRLLEHNLTGEDPVISELNAQNFNLEKNQLVAFGDASLDIDLLYPDRPISGTTVADAFINAEYVSGDNRNVTADATADSEGRYQLLTGEFGILPESTVTVTAVMENLYIRQQAAVQAEAPTVKFISVPERLDFGQVSIPDRWTELKQLNNDDFRLTVRDTGPVSSRWHIDVVLETELSAGDGRITHNLSDLLVFKDAGGSIHPVNQIPLTVYRKTEDTGQDVSVSWNEDEGFHLQVSPGEVYSEADYSGTVTWLLVDAP